MKEVFNVLHTEWSDGWGEQEIRIINEINALKELGHNVFLACRVNSKILIEAKEKSIDTITLPFKGNLDFKTIFLLIKLIKKKNIQIVNTHSGKDTWVGGIAAKICGVKFIRTRHLSNGINSSRLNFINEIADFVITTGESVKTAMISNNRILPDKIESIPTGIDPEKFNPKNFNKDEIRNALFGVPSDTLLIGIIAVLRAFKRHDRFLRMAKFVLEKNKNKKIKFLIIGDGPQRENIETLTLDLGIEKNVILTGHLDNIPEVLSALDIFVLTSDSGEGVPQSVMQALLMNKCVIATNAGSTGDLYRDENFVLVKKDSEMNLLHMCDELIKNESLRKNFERNSRSFVHENFSKKIMTKKIDRLYKEILK